MGLFGLFKKKQIDPITDDNGISGDADSLSTRFKGDLAVFKYFEEDASEDKSMPNLISDEVDTGTKYWEEPNDPEAELFMSFFVGDRATWICPECETINDKTLRKCVVCGLYTNC